MPHCAPSLKKLGYVIEEENDSILMWNGERCEPEEIPVIDTYEDHRMAMAFAPAVICHPNLLIADPQVVTKSYPGYWGFEAGRISGDKRRVTFGHYSLSAG